MDANPYKSPKGCANPRPNWRRRWRLACLACLCLAGVSIAVDLLLRAVLPGVAETRWAIILVGLLALGILSSLTLAGISAIGWVICRPHDPAINRSGSSSPESQVAD